MSNRGAWLGALAIGAVLWFVLSEPTARAEKPAPRTPPLPPAAPPVNVWIPVADMVDSRDVLSPDVMAQWLPSDDVNVAGYGVPDYYVRTTRTWAFRNAVGHVEYAPARADVVVLPREQL